MSSYASGVFRSGLGTRNPVGSLPLKKGTLSRRFLVAMSRLQPSRVLGTMLNDVSVLRPTVGAAARCLTVHFPRKIPAASEKTMIGVRLFNYIDRSMRQIFEDDLSVGGRNNIIWLGSSTSFLLFYRTLCFSTSAAFVGS
jgi:hypothetical protein